MVCDRRKEENKEEGREVIRKCVKLPDNNTALSKQNLQEHENLQRLTKHEIECGIDSQQTTEHTLRY